MIFQLPQIERLDVVEIEIKNKDLDNAVDTAELDLLVKEELYGASCGCFAVGTPHLVAPGAASAPDEVNETFGALLGEHNLPLVITQCH